MKIKISSGNGCFNKIRAAPSSPLGRHITVPHFSSFSPYLSPQAITTKLPLPYQMYKWASGFWHNKTGPLIAGYKNVSTQKVYIIKIYKKCVVPSLVLKKQPLLLKFYKFYSDKLSKLRQIQKKKLTMRLALQTWCFTTPPPIIIIPELIAFKAIKFNLRKSATTSQFMKVQYSIW